MLVYYFVPFIVGNCYLLFWVSNGHDSITVQNRTHVYMNFFDHKDLGNQLLQLCRKVVKHSVYSVSRRFPAVIRLDEETRDGMGSHKTGFGRILSFGCWSHWPCCLGRGSAAAACWNSRSHPDTSRAVGLLRTSDRPVADTFTWQHTTLTRDIHAPPPGGIFSPQQILFGWSNQEELDMRGT